VVGDILQPTHLLFIMVIALLVLGPKRLPEVGRSLGKGLRDFRSAISGEDSHVGFMTESTIDAEPAPAEAAPAAPAGPAATTEPTASAEATETPEPPLAAAATATREPSEHSD
jgi:sec-independent protein translocase protein TatA